VEGGAAGYQSPPAPWFPPVVTKPRVGTCFWCGAEGTVEDDHVFSRFLGGTRALVVPSCPACNRNISKFEQEVAAFSPLSAHRVVFGPAGGHDREHSGAGETLCTVTKDWSGTYVQIIMRARGDEREVLLQLPSIQIGLDGKGLHPHARSPEEYARLVAEVRKAFAKGKRPREVLRGMQVHVLPDGDPIAADPAFRPRMFLHQRGDLRVQARTRAEAKGFCVVLREHLDRLDAVGQNWTTKTNPKLTVSNRYLFRVTPLKRLAAKLALGVANKAAPRVLDIGGAAAAKAFVLRPTPEDGEPDPGSPVRWRRTFMHPKAKDLGAAWPACHVVLLEAVEGRARGVVMIYGGMFVVDLGPDADPTALPAPVVTTMPFGGGTPRLLAGDEGAAMAETVRGALASLPPDADL